MLFVPMLMLNDAGSVSHENNSNLKYFFDYFRDKSKVRIFQKIGVLFRGHFLSRVGRRFWLPGPRPAEQTPPTIYFFESSSQALSNAQKKQPKLSLVEDIGRQSYLAGLKITLFSRFFSNVKDHI